MLLGGVWSLCFIFFPLENNRFSERIPWKKALIRESAPEVGSVPSEGVGAIVQKDFLVKKEWHQGDSLLSKNVDSADRPTGTGASATSEIGGTVARARVMVGSKSYDLESNALGLFPRVTMPANTSVQIAVVYPEGTAADLLVVQAEDGGTIDQGTTVKQGRLDQTKTIVFEFKTSREEGVYRVTLRKGTDQKHFDFWVGPEPALQRGSSRI